MHGTRNMVAPFIVELGARGTGVIVATPGWALLGRDGPSTQDPGARWRLVGCAVLPVSLAGAGGLGC